MVRQFRTPYVIQKKNVLRFIDITFLSTAFIAGISNHLKIMCFSYEDSKVLANHSTSPYLGIRLYLKKQFIFKKYIEPQLGVDLPYSLSCD